ncbi:hypothetical protein NEIG_00111 [Nematocida sp. ERTm5]|nr:hypothetical protein NEIG_00111 [Nematocida sp. ERTm5]
MGQLKKKGFALELIYIVNICIVICGTVTSSSTDVQNIQVEEDIPLHNFKLSSQTNSLKLETSNKHKIIFSVKNPWYVDSHLVCVSSQNDNLKEDSQPSTIHIMALELVTSELDQATKDNNSQVINKKLELGDKMPLNPASLYIKPAKRSSSGIDVISSTKIKKLCDIDQNSKQDGSIKNETPDSNLAINSESHTTTSNIDSNEIPYTVAKFNENRYIMDSYINKNPIIIRNYTSCIEEVENIMSSNKSSANIIEKKALKVISDWEKDKKTNFWILIQSISVNFLKKKEIFLYILENYRKQINNICNPSFYKEILEDIIKYIDFHMKYIYNNSERYSSNCIMLMQETLGSVLANKEISLYCCCSGIDLQIFTEEKDGDIQLKKKLNAILLIPEVYEDFYKIPLNVINKFFIELKCELDNYIENCYIFTLKEKRMKTLIYLRYIIIYLISTAQKNEVEIEESYKKIKEIIVTDNCNKNIQDCSTKTVYYLVYNVVQTFYNYFSVAYKLGNVDKQEIKNRTARVHINIYSNRLVYKTLGAAAVASQKYLEFTVNFKNVYKMKEKAFIPEIHILKSKNAHISKTDTPISIKDHYHVQFVDNDWHTIQMIHLPYYLDKQENGEVIKQQLFRIKEIVSYLKLMFKIGQSNDCLKIGNVYPFKYCIKDKTWTMMTKESDLSKTVKMIEEENCNVVFYYIKEDIYKTEFCFIQFLYPSDLKKTITDVNANMPRVPLFISQMMYSLVLPRLCSSNYIKCKSYKGEEYNNLVPIDCIYNRYIPFYYNLQFVVKKHMKESDLNYAIKHYYSDFFIRNSTDFYEDPHCYCMNIQQEIDENDSNVSITWNTRLYESVYEYTTYKFDSNIIDERIHMSAIKQPAHASFIDMLQRKNPSLNTALYGHCFYKTRAEVDYKTSSIFCLTMKDLLEKMNAYLININAKDEIIDPISGRIFNKKNYDQKFILKDISSAIQNSKLQEIRQSAKGILSIRDNNYNGCKYGFHYDILSALVKTCFITSKMRLEKQENYK